MALHSIIFALKNIIFADYRKNSLIIILLIISLIFCLCIILLDVLLFSKTSVENDYSPEQIHIALGVDSTQMVIMWSTFSDPGQSIVKYGVDCKNLAVEESGSSTQLNSGGRIQYIHSVTLKYLMPSTFYCEHGFKAETMWATIGFSYSVGSHDKWSKKYEFITFPRDTFWIPTIAIFGDMGLENGRSIPSLIKNTINGALDMIIDIGDVAYTLYSFQGKTGDEFMRAIEPFAARVPFMVVPGNHEYACYDDRCPSDGGESYEKRFSMPKSPDNSFYSFTLGQALFIGISTEVYFESEMNDPESSQRQMAWLQQLLQDANEPENRARHPWIIVFGHRPLYCSAQSDCMQGLTVALKEGNVAGSLLDIEYVLYKYGVDLAFWGHEHNYERMWPVFNQTVFMGASEQETYKNPKAPINIISGAAGMHSENEPFDNILPIWSAFRSVSYGYTKITVQNATHLYLQQINVDQDDQVIDSIWIIQENHIPFPIKNKDLNLF